MAVYHHKGISRLKAEELLIRAKNDGSFLVRDSETVQGAYTLCLLAGGVVKQYRILPDNATKELYIQAEEGVINQRFKDISHLLENYIKRGEKNGLIFPLKYPVAPDSAVPDPDSDDEEDFVFVTESASQSQLHSQEVDGEIPDMQAPDVPVISKQHKQVLDYIKSRYEKLDLSSVDGQFVSGLQNYVNEGVTMDADVINSGTEKAQQLQQILNNATKELKHQLNVFLSKIDLCQELFGPLSGEPLTRRQKTASIRRMESCAAEESRETLDKLFLRLSSCKAEVQDLEEKAVCTLKELYDKAGSDSSDGHTPSLVPKMADRQNIPKKIYEVKYGKSGSKMLLTVDIAAGKLFAVKEKTGHSLDESNMIVSDRIQQLIKSAKDNCRLDLKIKDKKNMERYVFSEARDCESFCQMVKQMKMMHNIYSEVDHLNIFIGTWNMAENTAQLNLGPWLKCQGMGKTRDPAFSQIPFDMYVIGTQENPGHDKDWVKKVKSQILNNFGVEMHEVESESLWQIRLLILVKPEYKDKISHVTKASVATGLANTLGNKGGVGISFTFNLTTFCFVNAHLAARHDEKRNLKRHQNYRDIVKQLGLGPKNLQQVCDLTNRFHHVFFLGDLNYRLIDLSPQEIISKIQKKEFEYLLTHDQLKRAQKESKAFTQFDEGRITFPPTYRYQKGSIDIYSWEKMKKSGVRINAPSWCDRIMWKSVPDTHLLNTAYGAFQDSTSSDHKPVFASFEVGIQNQISISSSKKNPDQNLGDLKLCFEHVYAEVKSNGKERMHLEFHSTCLEKIVRGQSNTGFMENKAGYNRPRWLAQEIPKLDPLFDELEYLEEQFLIVAVKTEDGLESYGECVISLKSKLCKKNAEFDCILTHQGEKTGKLWGTMNVMSKGKPMNTSGKRGKQKSYDLVYTDADNHLSIVEPFTVPAEPEDPTYSEAIDKGRTATKTRSDIFNFDRPPAEVPKPIPTRKISQPNLIESYSTTVLSDGMIYTDVGVTNEKPESIKPPVLSANSDCNHGNKDINKKDAVPDLPAKHPVPDITDQFALLRMPSFAGDNVTTNVMVPDLPTKQQVPNLAGNSVENRTAANGSLVTSSVPDVKPKQPLPTKSSHPPPPCGNTNRAKPPTPEPDTDDRPPSLPPRRIGLDVQTTPLPFFKDKPANENSAKVVPTTTECSKRDSGIPELPIRDYSSRKQSNVSTSSDEDFHIYAGSVFQRINTFEAKSKTTQKSNDAGSHSFNRKMSDASAIIDENSAMVEPSVAKHKVETSPQYAQPDKTKKTAEWPKSMVLPPEENPIYAEKEGEELWQTIGREREPCQSDERDPSGAPPVLPPRKTRKPNEPDQTNYDVLHLPPSIDTWLEGLKLTDLISKFKANGWDRIDYLDDFDREDLINMGVTEAVIQERILMSIYEMKKN